MKNIYLILLFLNTCISFGQLRTEKQVQIGDTLNVYFDSTLIRQEVLDNYSMGMGLSYSKYYYAPETSSWLSDFSAPSIYILGRYRQFELLLTFRPTTINPKRNLVFNADTLTAAAQLNPIKLDLSLGYKVKLTNNSLFTPYLGYSISSFTVINEDQIGKKYDIPSTSGITLGANISYLLPVSFAWDIEFLLGAHYSFIDYSKVHPSLGKNYWGVDLGIKILEWSTTKIDIIKTPPLDTQISLENAWSDVRKTSLAVGFNMAQFINGIHLYSSYSGFALDLTYHLGRSDNRSEIVYETSSGVIVKLSAPFGVLYNDVSTSVLYFGLGISYLKENQTVLSYTGTGSISGTQYFIGWRGLGLKNSFFYRLKPFFEIGYSSWDYTNSILNKNRSDKSYNYPKFFFSFGIDYSIF